MCSLARCVLSFYISLCFSLLPRYPGEYSCGCQSISILRHLRHRYGEKVPESAHRCSPPSHIRCVFFTRCFIDTCFTYIFFLCTIPLHLFLSTASILSLMYSFTLFRHPHTPAPHSHWSRRLRVNAQKQSGPMHHHQWREWYVSHVCAPAEISLFSLPFLGSPFSSFEFFS